jgi:hypothetical protein
LSEVLHLLFKFSRKSFYSSEQLLEVTSLSLKTVMVASIIVSTLLAFITPTQTSAVIIDHIENGQREIYDTEDPMRAGCESIDMICFFPPNE